MFINRKNRILYIERLDYFSLFVGFIFQPFFSKILFFSAISQFQSKKSMKKLSYFGFNWISFTDVPVNLYLPTFVSRVNYGEKVLKNQLTERYIYSFLIDYFKLDKLGLNKLEASLKRQVTNGFLAGGTASITLIEHYFGKSETKIFYLASKINNLLLAYETSSIRIVPLGIHCLMLGLTNSIVISLRFFVKCFRVFFSRVKRGIYGTVKRGIGLLNRQKTVDESFGKKINSFELISDQYEIGFFPHKNLMYGTFFKKTYLYDDNPDSLFYRKRLLTIFFGNTDSVSERYLKLYKIPYVNLSSFLSRKMAIKELGKLTVKINKIKIIKECFSLKNLIRNYFIFQFIIRLVSYNNIMNQFKSLKLIYFHYDILIPNVFLLACHLNSIKTVSAQNRPINYTWDVGLIYDHYFLAGQGFKKKLINRHYSIGCYHVIGMPRSDYIKEPGNKPRYRKILDIKQKFTLVVCYIQHSLNDFQVGLESEIASETKNMEYFVALVKLAKEFPNLYFVLKPKMQEIFTSRAYREVERTIMRIPNLEMITDLRRYNSYVMSYLADIIIGRYTTILDESFSAGKKIIIYDSEKWIQSTDYALNEIDVIEDTYEGLRKRIVDITQNGNYLDQNKWDSFNNQYYTNMKDKDGFQRTREKISDIFHDLPTDQ